ncbi:MAG TPA: hypothetical protein VK358_08750 [Longimicrobium sp.]|nr:hypothetical protein [Longimicrobium sp.]
MNVYYEIVFWCAQVVIALGIIGIVWGVGLIFYERYVEGNVDAFKPERRHGPADRRGHLPAG